MLNMHMKPKYKDIKKYDKSLSIFMRETELYSKIGEITGKNDEKFPEKFVKS